MAKLTPQEFANKLSSRLRAAVDDIRKGVERVSDAPTRRAAAKKEKFRNGINSAIDSGAWERGLQAVSLEDWKSKMLNKGVNRVATGIEDAKPKIEAFAAKLMAHQDSLKAEIERMPDNTLEDRIARAQAWIRGMAKFRK